VKLEEVKLEAGINLLEVMFDRLDPVNQMIVLTATMDNISENKMLFPYSYSLDLDELETHLEKVQKDKEDQQQLMQDKGQSEIDGNAHKINKMDSAKPTVRERLRAKVAALR